MQIVSLAGYMEDFFLNGEFIKTKVEGKKVELKIALSDPEDDSFKTSFVMKFDLDNIDSFNELALLVEKFFYEQPDEFNVEDFLGRKCEVHMAEVYFGDRTERKIESIKSLKSDYKGITQHHKKMHAASECLSECSEEEKRAISALFSDFRHSQA